MVWYGIVWYSMVWYGMAYGMVRHGTARRYVTVRYGVVWYDMVWYGIVYIICHILYMAICGICGMVLLLLLFGYVTSSFNATVTRYSKQIQREANITAKTH